jgi:drug/metabolite transporter (DMT)-like permease
LKLGYLFTFKQTKTKTMFDILKHAHSGLRWIVLAFLIYAIYNAFTKWQSGKPFGESDRKANLFTLISTHIQVVLGFVLYFMSARVQFGAETMKDSMLRFFAVEHLAMMLIAAILITVGNVVSKKAADDASKFKKTFIYFLIALIVILVAIPWPFRGFGNGWF